VNRSCSEPPRFESSRLVLPWGGLGPASSAQKSMDALLSPQDVPYGIHPVKYWVRALLDARAVRSLFTLIDDGSISTSWRFYACSACSLSVLRVPC